MKINGYGFPSPKNNISGFDNPKSAPEYLELPPEILEVQSLPEDYEGDYGYGYPEALEIPAAPEWFKEAFADNWEGGHVNYFLSRLIDDNNFDCLTYEEKQLMNFAFMASKIRDFGDKSFAILNSIYVRVHSNLDQQTHRERNQHIETILADLRVEIAELFDLYRPIVRECNTQERLLSRSDEPTFYEEF